MISVFESFSISEKELSLYENWKNWKILKKLNRALMAATIM